MTRALFPDASPLPEPTPRRISPFVLSDNAPARVRFVEGFEPFATFVAAHDADPALLRDDLSQLISFLAQHSELLDDRALTESAGIFLGNSIATLHLEAQWKVLSEPSVGRNGYEFPVYRAIRGLIEQPDLHNGFREAATNWAA